MTSVRDIHYSLVEQCESGIRSAQKEVYMLYAKSMYNICYRMMNNAEEAQDLLQDSFVEAFSKLESFRFESSFGAWLKQIVVNRCINAKNKRKLDYFSVEEIENYEYAENEDTNSEEEELLTVERIKQKMLQLPEGARMVFSLHLLEGYDYTEIAQILSITETTAKTQFMRAKNKMKELLKGEKE